MVGRVGSSAHLPHRVSTSIWNKADTWPIISLDNAKPKTHSLVKKLICNLETLEAVIHRCF